MKYFNWFQRYRKANLWQPKTVGVLMAINRNSLKKPRSHAFSSQRGRCYYCRQPMWQKQPEELTSKFPLTYGQAKMLRCTGEHLVAHGEGGSCKRKNIVAACHYCNQHRHRRKAPLSPEQFGNHVRLRLKCGRWHRLNLVC
jgi:hypothetical protein